MTNTKTFGELSRDEKLELMAYWVDGGELEFLNSYTSRWVKLYRPSWHEGTTYRKAQTKPSIDWAHVSDDFNWLAVDEGGDAYFFKTKPESEDAWGAWFTDPGRTEASTFKSYTRGDCDWTDSLVMRPGYEGGAIMDKPDWKGFGMAIMYPWPESTELDAFDIEQYAIKHGILVEVEGGFDPEKHTDDFCVYPEKGDPWFVRNYD